MGLRAPRWRCSTLADAIYESRDWRIYADFAQVLIQASLAALVRSTRCRSAWISIKVSTLWTRPPSVYLCLVAVPVGQRFRLAARLYREDATRSQRWTLFGVTSPTFRGLALPLAKRTTSTSSTSFSPRPAAFYSSWIGPTVDFERLFVEYTLCSSFYRSCDAKIEHACSNMAPAGSANLPSTMVSKGPSFARIRTVRTGLSYRIGCCKAYP